MVGDPAIPVIVDTYIKGIRDFDIQRAYQTILTQTALAKSPASNTFNLMRPGYASLLKYGFIPNDDKGGDYVWGSVSTALEYNFADWCAAQLALQMNDNASYQILMKRSKGFTRYFDKQHLLFRPKRADGTFVQDFNPIDNFRELGWMPSGGIGFVEGTAWQYTWFVPHDVAGLIQLFGGEKKFVRQLQTCFDSSYFVLSNEPDMAYPFLFNYVKGEEWRSQREVRRCIEKYFGVGSDGIPGNDDCGTLSAWLVFAMMGFYPDCPGSDTYQLVSPVFERITLTLHPTYHRGKIFVITTPRASNTTNAVRIQAMTLNAAPLKEYNMSHTIITNGGHLDITLTTP
jgi:predicted alpha-1,2-mannosidase